jgi:hypothetical protein
MGMVMVKSSNLAPFIFARLLSSSLFMWPIIINYGDTTNKWGYKWHHDSWASRFVVHEIARKWEIPPVQMAMLAT